MSATLTITGKNETGQAFKEIRADAKQTATGVGKLDDELKASAASAKSLGDTGRKELKGLAIQVTGVNQALEIMKKGAELAARGVVAMAERGSPAFVDLLHSVEDVQEAFAEVANDPAMQNFISDIAGVIQTDLVPAIRSIPDVAGPALANVTESFRSAQRWIANATLDAGAFLGVFDEAVTEELKLTKELQDARDAEARQQAELAAAARDAARLEKDLAGIRDKVAADGELQRLAKIQDEQIIKTLLEEEREAITELSAAGDLDSKKRQEAYRKIELLERRLAELPAERAEAEIKAAQEAAQARTEAEKAYQQALADTKKAADEARQMKIDQEKAEAEKVIADLQSAIAQAKGLQGGSALDDLRGKISGGDLRRDLLRSRQEAAKAQLIEQWRADGLVDQSGKAIGNTTEERRANQRRLDSELARAAKQATIIATHQMRRGGISADEIRDLQDARLMAAGNKAFGSDTAEGKAFRSQMEADRAAFNRQNQQQAFAQKVAALVGSVGGELPGATGNLAGTTGQLADVAGKGVAQAISTATAAETKAQAAIDMIMSANEAARQSAARTRAQRGRY